MKKILLLSFLLFGYTLIYSQIKKNIQAPKATKNEKLNNTVPTVTKVETQEWIKEKMENFTHDYNELNGTEYGIDKYEIEFSDCLITIREKKEGKSQNVFNGQWKNSFIYITYKIPIQQLSTITFIPENKVTRVLFKIKSNATTINEIVESSLPSYEEKTVNVAILYISNNLLKEDLPERLTKAFDNLIKLCGGKVVNDVF